MFTDPEKVYIIVSGERVNTTQGMLKEINQIIGLLVIN